MSIDLVFFSYLLSTLYGVLILFFIAGIFKLSKQRDQEIKPLSVIIAARNEEDNLPLLGEALKEQDYPLDKYEVIIIDDRSEDNSWEILENLRTKLPNLKTSRIQEEDPQLVGKKGALAKGIEMAEHDILAFTDADCLPGKAWLKEINALMTTETDFLCGYAPLTGDGNLVNQLKNLERSSIFAVIAGSLGWNWGLTSVARSQVYRKSIYQKVNGFEGIGRERSGDDDLMLQKLSAHLRKCNFIFTSEAEVPSADGKEAQSQVNLEVRRASKWRVYPLSIKILTLGIMIYYLVIAIDLIFMLTGSLPVTDFAMIILLKVACEFLLLFVFLAKVKRLRLMKVFPLAELLYIPYFVYFGLRGTFGKYRWKD